MTILIAIALCVAVVAAQVFWTLYVCDVAEKAASNLEAKLPRLTWHPLQQVYHVSGCPNAWLMLEVIKVLVAERVLEARLAGVLDAELLDPDDPYLFSLRYSPSELEYRLCETPRRRKRKRKKEVGVLRPAPIESPIRI